MKIYTKAGDQGNTSFLGGTVRKDDLRIDALGAVDELNSVIGITLCFVDDAHLREGLTKIQHDLFTLGADLAGPNVSNLPRISPQHITEVEKIIDELEEKLGMPQKFILPGGTVASSFLHLCRATTRRTERVLVGLEHNNTEILKYINRLGDLFYVLARDANKEVSIKEQHPLYRYFREKS